MYYRKELTVALVRLTLLTSVTPDPFCQLLSEELRSLCKKLYLAVPLVPAAIRRGDGGQFLLPQALEMLNRLINETSKYFDYRDLAFELRQIKRRVILRHTSTRNEVRSMLTRIVANLPNSGGLDE